MNCGCFAGLFGKRKPKHAPFVFTFAQAPAGGFAASYEKGQAKNFAFLIPGDEELFVGGGALNGAVGKLLMMEGKQAIAFDRGSDGKITMVTDHNGKEVPKYDKEKCPYAFTQKRVFDKARQALIATGKPTTYNSEGSDLGKNAPMSLCAGRVYSRSTHPFGAAFINVFKKSSCPFNNHNVALLYTVGALGRNMKAEGEGKPDKERADLVKTNVKEFLQELYLTGENVVQLVLDYNKSRTPIQPAIEVVRFPIVSGGIFIHPEVTPKEVALALLWGIHSAFAGASPSELFTVELMPGDPMQKAYQDYMGSKKPSDWKSQKNIFGKIPDQIA